jgi:hypothetical protein
MSRQTWVFPLLLDSSSSDPRLLKEVGDLVFTNHLGLVYISNPLITILQRPFKALAADKSIIEAKIGSS